MAYNPARFMGSAMALGLLAGCGSGDPASEAPVEMIAGQYETAFVAPALAGGKKSDVLKHCVTGSAEFIPSKIVRPYLSLDPHCGTAKFERNGNKLTGTAICPLDPERAVGKAVMKFEGTIAKEAIEGFVQMDMQIESAQDPQAKQAAAAMSAAQIPFSAKRTGDCSG